MIAVLVSTTFDRILNVQPEQFPIRKEIFYIFSCQGKKHKSLRYYKNHLDSIFGDRYIFSVTNRTGLSANRNNCMESLINSNIQYEFAYIADDDIFIVEDALISIVKKAQKYNLNLVTGKILDKNGEDFKTNYGKCIRKHSIFSLAKVSSVEILMSRKLINQHIRFDERFGLGSSYPSGEEYIFCSDIYKKEKNRCYYFPIGICIHPTVTSGADFFSSQDKIKAKGAMFRRIFGFYFGIMFCIIFSIKKFPIIKNNCSLFYFIKNLFSGFKNLGDSYYE